INNAASVSATETDPVPANNSASDTASVKAAADLAVSMSHTPEPVLAGANLTYTVTVTNNGPSAATAVTLTDTLPHGSTLVSATPTRGTCSGTWSLSCSIGNLAKGATTTTTIVVTAPTTAGSISSTASVAGNETDLVPGNNSASDSATVKPVADLAVSI